MSELHEDKEIIKLEKRLIENKGQQDFVLEVRQMGKEALKSKLSQLAEYKNEILSTKARDEELKKAVELANGLRKPYTEDLAFNKMKDRFVALVLKEGSFDD